LKIVLAYSGGLDTTATLARYREEGHEVVAVYVDVGQPGDLGEVRNRAVKAGACAIEIVDCRANFADEFLAPALAANAMYEGRYPLVSALSRPAIAKAMADVALAHGADAAAHGCTGKGNDQVRFEVSLRALIPELTVLAPIRDWELSRDAALELLEAAGVEIDITKRSPYSIDENIWGRACECGVLENPWEQPPADAYEWTNDPAAAPGVPMETIVGFENGLPVTLDGRHLSFLEILSALNELGGRYGTGRIDMVENRLVGIKSREVYECPGALALILAHQDLESLVLERDLAKEKARLEIRWAEIVYNGLWHSPLREALDTFFASSQQGLDGEVRLSFSPGCCTVTGRRSPVSLYDESLATYSESDSFDHTDARGFVRLWGLPVAQAAASRSAARAAHAASKVLA